VQDSLDGQYVAQIILTVKGAFDAAWWPSILTSLKTLKCPRNLYNLFVSYINERSTILLLNSSIEQRKISKGCSQGSASGPGVCNLKYNSLLNLEFTEGVYGGSKGVGPLIFNYSTRRR
jgi:hypothetical protein